MDIQNCISKVQKPQLLSIQELKTIYNLVIPILLQQPNVIEVKGEFYIIGDIHGQFYDLKNLLLNIIPNISNKKYVFLGDYVDRGYNSIQTICLLLTYKCKYPSNIILLRGNHETSSLTKIYGFYDEIYKKYGNIYPWKIVTQIFQYLPLAAIVQNEIMCVHGGLSPNIPFVHDISNINRIKEIPEVGPMSDLVWSDPEPSIQNWSISNRGAGYLFPHEAAKQFLFTNGLKMIVRAHQLVEEGHNYNFDDESVVTVWSAPNYCYRCGNKAAVLKIQENSKKQFIVFNPAEQTPKVNISYEYVLPYFL